MGDHFVSLLKRPDGRIEEVPAGTYAIRQNGKAVVTTSFSWPMASFESNRITEIAARLREIHDGRVVSFDPRKPFHVFTATNDRGGVIEGSVELRSAPAESGDQPAVFLAIESTRTWPNMLMAFLRVSGSFGYTLQGIGLSGNGTESDTHTSISRDGAGNSSCRWNLPPGFSTAESEAIARQLEALKASTPNGLRVAPDERVPVFAVTNQAGTVFRGYFKLSGAGGSK